MAQVDYIRHEANQKGETYASIGRRMGIDPRTVKNMQIKRNLKEKRNKNENPQ